MTLRQQVTETVRALAEPVLARAGIELVDVEYRREPNGMILRLIIDRPGGVSVDDCADVSRWLGDILDVKDPVPEAYNLEVSSPGINRPLKRPADFVRFAGENVLIKTRVPVEGRKTFRGRLEGCEESAVHLTIDNNKFWIPLDQITKARLDVL